MSEQNGFPAGSRTTLQTKSVNNIVQSLLNLVQGSNVTLTDNGDGSVTIAASGGGGGTVTAVTGTAPITSSGGATPAIGIGVASSSVFGAVKVDGTTITAAAGVISAVGGSGTVTAVTGTAPIASSGGATPAISVAAATSAALGVVQPDGTIITVVAGAITVPKASSSVFGVVEVDGTTITAAAGVISAVGGSGGALTQIAQQVFLSNGTVSINFAAIPQTFSNLILVVSGRTGSANDGDLVNVQINGDTASHYQYSQISADELLAFFSGTGNGGFTAIAPIGAITGSSSTAGYSGTIVATFGGYAGTAFFKSAVCQSSDHVSGRPFIRSTAWAWASTAAITSMQIGNASSGNSFTGVAGTTITLYGQL